MPSSANKKLAIMYILKILEDYSDSEHLLTQQDIIEKIYTKYGMECERKSISSNIDSLMDIGYDIVKTSNGCYLNEREFENSELRFLIDSVLYSKHIQNHHANNLIDKLVKKGNKYFKKTVKEIHNLNNIYHSQSPEMFYVIDMLGEAIDRNRQVKFTLNEFGVDKKLHPSLENIIVNPYELVFSNGDYYLIGNTDIYDNISNYRIDKISHIEILETVAKPIIETEIGKENLNSYIISHPFLFSGVSERILIRIDEENIGKVIDSFGDNLSITKYKYYSDTKKLYDVSFTANSKDVIQWTL